MITESIDIIVEVRPTMASAKALCNHHFDTPLVQFCGELIVIAGVLHQDLGTATTTDKIYSINSIYSI